MESKRKIELKDVIEFFESENKRIKQAVDSKVTKETIAHELTQTLVQKVQIDNYEASVALQHGEQDKTMERIKRAINNFYEAELETIRMNTILQFRKAERKRKNQIELDQANMKKMNQQSFEFQKKMIEAQRLYKQLGLNTPHQPISISTVSNQQQNQLQNKDLTPEELQYRMINNNKSNG